MRKTTICLLLLLSSLAAFGQSELHWTVVKHVILTSQSAAIPRTTIFTPTKPGFYRLSAYISTAGQYASWNLEFYWTDAAGEATNVYINAETGPCSGGQNCTAAQMSYVLVPQAATPVSYAVVPYDTPAGAYNIVFTNRAATVTVDCL
jgi:hypothetical protein